MTPRSRETEVVSTCIKMNGIFGTQQRLVERLGQSLAASLAGRLTRFSIVVAIRVSQPLAERLRIDADPFRGLSSMSSGLRERPGGVAALQLAQRNDVAMKLELSGRVVALVEEIPQIINADFGGAREQDQLLDRVGELSNVSGPPVLFQLSQRLS